MKEIKSHNFILCLRDLLRFHFIAVPVPLKSVIKLRFRFHYGKKLQLLRLWFWFRNIADEKTLAIHIRKKGSPAYQAHGESTAAIINYPPWTRLAAVLLHSIVLFLKSVKNVRKMPQCTFRKGDKEQLDGFVSAYYRISSGSLNQAKIICETEHNG
jgi:hypothetical protein